VTFVSATTTQGECSHSSATVTCNIGSLAAGFDGSVAIEIALKPTPTGEILRSEMRVAANEPDLDLTDNFAAPTGTLFTLVVSMHGTGTGTVTSDPAGIDCGTACSLGVWSNSTVTLTATPAPGSVFTGWSDGGPCNGPSTTCAVDNVAMWGPQTVVATFDKAPPPPSSEAGRSGGGACTWWELCGMLLLGLSRRLSGKRFMTGDNRGVRC
jgi:hypothetical protein